MQERRFVVFALVAIAAVTSGAMLAQSPQAVGTWASLGEIGAPLPRGAAVALPDGRTLIVGGLTTEGVPTASVTSFDPADKSVTDVGALVAPRSGHTATLLRDGRVLVVGGLTEGGLLSNEIEIFDPAASTSSLVSLLPEPRHGHVAARLLDGTVLIAGGATIDGAVLRSAVSFDPKTGTVSPVTGELRVGRINAAAATLLDGRVLIAGGFDGATELKSAELYENYSHTFAIAATRMSVARQGHSAILLPHNGGVLVVGGTSDDAAQAGADLFLPAVFPDPFTFGEGEFTATGATSVARPATIAGPTSVEGFAFAAGGDSAEEVYRFATIKTDTDDYAPGELAEITGSGWQPGERVTLVFQEDPAVHEDYVLEVTADSTGNIYWNQWAPEGHDLGVRFYLTAIGSKSRAQVTFTDAADTTTTVSTSPNPSAPGDTVTATATVMAGSSPVTQGPVKFYFGGANCTGNPGTQFGPAGGVVPNSSGQASASTTLLTNGITVRACYGGFGNGSSALQSSSGTVVQTVAVNIATVTAVSSSANPSVFGGNVTFTAVVTRTSGSGTPTGAVQFAIDGVNVGAPVALGAPSSATSATASSASISGLTAGTHAVDAVYIPTGNFTTSSDALDGGQVVGKADAVCTINGHTGTYDAASHGASGSCVGVGTDTGATGSSLDLGASFTNAPGGTAHWLFSGGTNYKDQSGSVAIVINKADAACTVTGYTGTYDATAHGAAGSCSGVDNGAAAGGSLDLGASFTNAPGGTANWSFTGGTNYKDQNGGVAIVINKADAACTVTGHSGTYDATAHGASGSCSGVDNGAAAGGSLSLGASFTNAPGGTANWLFSGGTNYKDQGGSVAIVIGKADAACTVTGYTGTFDATAHGAAGSCSGVDNGAAAGSSLDLGASFTNAPGGTANWSFTGGTNYKDQDGSVAIEIGKADAVCTIDGFTGPYDAASHGASGACAGIAADPSAAGSSLNLGASFTNAPGGTGDWSFAGGDNYNDQSGSVAIVISKADAVCTIDGHNGVYDGHAHGASGSCAGIAADPSAAGSSLALGSTFTNAPGGTANWSFNGGDNYNDQSGSVAIVIGKADAVCTIAGFDGVYDGHEHGATGSCAGVDDGAAAGSSLNRGASFTNVPGGTATWAFDGGINYNDQGGSVAITIAKAAATVTVTGYTGMYDAQPHGATGTATGVLNEALAGLTLGATFTDYPGGTAHWVFSDQTGNYNDASGDVGITISKANATIVVNGYTGMYDAQPHGATGSATGVGGVNLTAGINFGSSFANVPGGTAHWTFAGGLNYHNANGTATITITKANATCGVSGYDVIYDGAFHVATGGCTGVNGVSLAGLDLTGTTHKDAGDYTDNWTFTDVTGNYYDASGTVADTIRHWTTSGFYQPVDMSNSQLVWNTVKGGSTVPLKFNLFAGAEKKTSVADVKTFAVAELVCTNTALEAAVEFTTTGGTQLRYDGTASQFIQNWQTPKASGRCFMVRMTAQDGSTIDAYFKTK
jgi:hypothetical protein